MFGFLKKVFSKPAESPPDAPAAPPAAPAPAQAARAPSAQPLPASSGPPAPVAARDAVLLPLNNVLSQLPGPVAALVASRPGGTISLPASTVIDQLRSGAVRIPLSQLRQSAPPGTFTGDTSHDDSLIDLPLPLVLAALSPAMLTRRTDQKRVEVPEEVTGVFGPKGAIQEQAVPTPSTPAPAASPTPAPAASPTPAPTTTKPAAPPAPPAAPTVSPAPVVAAAPAPSLPKPVVPVAPKLLLPKPVVPAAPLPSLSKPVLPTPGLPKPLTSISPRPASPSTPALAPLPFAKPKPASPLPGVTPPRPALPTAPAAVPDAPGEAVVATIAAVCEAWPEAIRQEIEQGDAKGASISIPKARLDAAMKTGRVLFTWGQLRDWLDRPASAPSPHAATQVELPLKVMTPLFLAKHRAITQKKFTVGDSVPDLFVAMPKAAAPPAVAEAPAPAAVAETAPPAKSAAEADVLGSIFGQPAKTDWSLNEIAQGISALPGVAYSILATADGLLVAGQAPAPMNANTLAAFLPQMFGRAAHYAVEAQIGTLEALTLTVGQSPHLIIKAGPLYLGVVGRPGQNLPGAALQSIAGQLARRNQ